MSPARSLYAAGVICLATTCLISAEFIYLQPLGGQHQVLAETCGVFLLVAGAGLLWREAAFYAALTLLAFVAIILLLIDLPEVAAHATDYGVYFDPSELCAIGAGALIITAAQARMPPGRARRLARAGQVIFGLCALQFGAAHFVYSGVTASMVPRFLPPSQIFWAYATGAAHVAAGLAILAGVQARLAAVLLTVMYASFTPLVHLPMLLADPASHFIRAENALNVLLTGVAWVVADSLQPPADQATPPAG